MDGDRAAKHLGGPLREKLEQALAHRKVLSRAISAQHMEALHLLLTRANRASPGPDLDSPHAQAHLRHASHQTFKSFISLTRGNLAMPVYGLQFPVRWLTFKSMQIPTQQA